MKLHTHYLAIASQLATHPAFCFHINFILPWTSNYTVHLLFDLLSAAETSSAWVKWSPGTSGLLHLVSYPTLVCRPPFCSPPLSYSAHVANPYPSFCLCFQADEGRGQKMTGQNRCTGGGVDMITQSSVQCARLRQALSGRPTHCRLVRLQYTMKVFCVSLLFCIGVIPVQGQIASECVYKRGELRTNNAAVPLLSATLRLRDPIHCGPKKAKRLRPGECNQVWAYLAIDNIYVDVIKTVKARHLLISLER